jgi:hypothetical protein
MTVHNFKFDLEKQHIPLLIGKGGKNLFNKVIKASIDEFKNKTDCPPCQQEKIDMVKNGKLKIKGPRIEIKHNDEVAKPFTYATWSDNKELGDGNTNTILNSLIQINLVKCKEEIAKYVDMKEKTAKTEKTEKKYRQNFNFRMSFNEDVEIGQFIGNGGEIINDFKKKIAETLDVEKVYINIDDFDKDTYMYRVIGNVISDDDLMFKISYMGGKREDILKVEEMLKDFVNENIDQDDSVESDDESEEDKSDEDKDDKDDKDEDKDEDKDDVDYAAGGW